MHLIITIDLAGDAFQHGDIGAETCGILHHAADMLGRLHADHGALSYENPEQLYLCDKTGAVVGYVSTVEIGDMVTRTTEHIKQSRLAAGADPAASAPDTRSTPDRSGPAKDGGRRLPTGSARA